MKSPYAELHCLSNYSFLRGASHPEELVLRAAELGYEAIALTDECSVAGVVRAHEAAKQAGIRFIVGSEFCIDDSVFVLLAPDHEAYAQMVGLITHGRRQAEKGSYRLETGDLTEHPVDRCLLLVIPPPRLFALPRNEAARTFPQGQTTPENATGALAWIVFENTLQGHQNRQLDILKEWSRRLGAPLAAAGDVRMHRRERRPLLDVMSATRLHCTVMELGQRAAANGEHHLRSRRSLAALYDEELLAETLAISELLPLLPRQPTLPVPAGDRAGGRDLERIPSSSWWKRENAGAGRRGRRQRCRR